MHRLVTELVFISPIKDKDFIAWLPSTPLVVLFYPHLSE